MAKLILSLDDLVLQEIPLSKERTTIGRKPHNDIQIDNLAVSGEHAVIVTVMNDCFLEDLGSTNGTLVNGVLAKKHLLQNNDVIELGKYKLKFFGVAATPAPTPADYEKTMVWRPPGAKPRRLRPPQVPPSRLRPRPRPPRSSPTLRRPVHAAMPACQAGRGRAYPGTCASPLRRPSTAPAAAHSRPAAAPGRRTGHERKA